MSEEKENPHIELIKAVTAMSANDQQSLYKMLQYPNSFDDAKDALEMLKKGYEKAKPLADLIIDSDVDPNGAILTIKTDPNDRLQFIAQLDGEPKTFSYQDAEELSDWLEDFLVARDE